MKVIVVGGGAAGLLAAIAAARKGARVTLLEKNEKLGKKIYITGKGRCNLTNACDYDQFMKKVVRNPKFLYSSVKAFGSQDIMDLLEEGGCPVKVERGNRVFPVSDHASDVTKALEKLARDCGVKIRLNVNVKGLIIENGKIKGVTDGKNTEEADRVIVATGGLSYPTTGSTGDGYKWAKASGHEISPTSPSLVSILGELKNYPVSELAGLSLKNVTLNGRIGKKTCKSEIGELLFTHTGISGPLSLTLSTELSGMKDFADLWLSIDWKPAMSPEEIDARLIREFEGAKNKAVKNVLPSMLPGAATSAVLAAAGIPEDKPVHDLTKAERNSLVSTLKAFPVKVTGLGDYNEAVITRGGVSTKEINPKTMESKLVKGLYFAGEVMDVDACTGGFNLQIAWSTGYAAGSAAAEGEEEYE